MVVYNLHIKNVAFFPFKTDAPLIVDADAPLSLAITLQSFQPVAWQYLQLIKNVSQIHLQKVTACGLLYVSR